MSNEKTACVDFCINEMKIIIGGEIYVFNGLNAEDCAYWVKCLCKDNVDKIYLDTFGIGMVIADYLVRDKVVFYPIIRHRYMGEPNGFKSRKSPSMEEIIR